MNISVKCISISPIDLDTVQNCSNQFKEYYALHCLRQAYLKLLDIYAFHVVLIFIIIYPTSYLAYCLDNQIIFEILIFIESFYTVLVEANMRCSAVSFCETKPAQQCS